MEGDHKMKTKNKAKEIESKMIQSCKLCVRIVSENCKTADTIYYEYDGDVHQAITRTYRRKFVKYNEQDIEDQQMNVWAMLFENDPEKDKPCCFRIRAYKPGKMSLGGWLILITIRYISNDLRGKKLNQIRVDEFAIQIEDAFHLIPQGQHRIINSFKDHVIDMIHEEINQFPNELDRLILKLRFYDGLTPQEISDFLGISIATVYQRQSRAVRKLRKILKKRILEMDE